MSCSYTATSHADYLQVDVEGHQTLDTILELFQYVGTQVAAHKQRKVLVDYDRVVLNDLSTRERLSVGMQLAAEAGDVIIAVIYNGTRVPFAIMTAGTVGSRITTVRNSEEGINWLRQQKERSG